MVTLYHFEVSILPSSVHLSSQLTRNFRLFVYIWICFSFRNWLLMCVPDCIFSYYRKELPWIINLSQFYSLHAQEGPQTNWVWFPFQYKIVFLILSYLSLWSLFACTLFSNNTWPFNSYRSVVYLLSSYLHILRMVNVTDRSKNTMKKEQTISCTVKQEASVWKLLVTWIRITMERVFSRSSLKQGITQITAVWWYGHLSFMCPVPFGGLRLR